MFNPPILLAMLEELGSPVPMFNGVGKEWLPAFKVSWHVPHVPVSEGIPPATRPPADTSSLIPATSVMFMGLELKIACPRAMAARGSPYGRDAHALKVLKINGVNPPSPGELSPPGCSNWGSSACTLEFALIKNG